LDGKIGLTLGDDFLGGIGVLNGEVAGLARHHHRLSFFLDDSEQAGAVGGVRKSSEPIKVQAAETIASAACCSPQNGYKIV
jgi:hypothetical protein